MNLSSGIDLIKKSIDVFFEKKNLIFLLKVYFFALLVGLLFYFPQRYSEGIDLGEFIKQPFVGPGIGISALVYLFLDFLTKTAGYVAVKKVVAKEKFDIKETFSSALAIMPRFFAVSVLVGIVVSFGFILLIIPGIIFGTWYAFSLFILINEKTGILESMRRSKALVKGRFWMVLGRLFVFMLFSILGNIVFSFLPFSLGAVVVTIFGGLFLLPAYFLYRELA
jgi:hypothetical protein